MQRTIDGQWHDARGRLPFELTRDQFSGLRRDLLREGPSSPITTVPSMEEGTRGGNKVGLLRDVKVGERERNDETAIPFTAAAAATAVAVATT